MYQDFYLDRLLIRNIYIHIYILISEAYVLQNVYEDGLILIYIVLCDQASVAPPNEPARGESHPRDGADEPAGRGHVRVRPQVGQHGHGSQLVMVIGIKLMNLYEKEALGGHGSWVAIGGQSHESQVGIDMGGHGYCHHEPAGRRLGVFMIMDHGWSWVNRSS